MRCDDAAGSEFRPNLFDVHSFQASVLKTNIQDDDLRDYMHSTVVTPVGRTSESWVPVEATSEDSSPIEHLSDYRVQISTKRSKYRPSDQ